MPFTTDTYRVLIASPSDLSEERDAASAAIAEWNAQHAVAEQTVLLPVRWETHARPTSGVRPQSAINDQIVGVADVLIGMFWTKLGTPTGGADSGTVEEIARFVAAGKPAMLYFSARPVDPNKIDLKQHKKLRAFKASTYNNALVGSFSSTSELRQNLMRDLTNQMRQIRGSGRSTRRKDRTVAVIEREAKLTEVIAMQRKNKITPEEVRKYREELLGTAMNRTNAQVTDPVEPGQKGPNGFRIGYTKDGDKVEWVPDEEHPGKEWPLLLRRSDKSIVATYKEFWDKVWWNRHQCRIEKVMADKTLTAAKKRAEMKIGADAAKRIEKKYGRKNLGWDDFAWGMLTGRMSALSWVLGSDWEGSSDT